jgi:hypothetical protein
MVHKGWRVLAEEDPPPRHFDQGGLGWYRYPMVSEGMGDGIGARKLRQLRSSSLDRRDTAAEAFAAKLADLLSPGACATFMPSSTRPSAHSDRASVPHLVLSHLRRCRPDLVVVEPLIRRAPVPSVHESRTHDIALLCSTLEPVQLSIPTDLLYVIDDMVATGATYAAFRRAFRRHWPHVETSLVTLVYSPLTPKWFE